MDGLYLSELKNVYERLFFVRTLIQSWGLPADDISDDVLVRGSSVYEDGIFQVWYRSKITLWRVLPDVVPFPENVASIALDAYQYRVAGYSNFVRIYDPEHMPLIWKLMNSN